MEPWKPRCCRGCPDAKMMCSEICAKPYDEHEQLDAEVARLGGINTKMNEMLIEERAHYLALFFKDEYPWGKYLPDAEEQIEKELKERKA